MALIVTRGEQGAAGGEALPRVEVRERGYNYPNGKDLKPGSPLHVKVLGEIMRRAEDSFNVMSDRHDTWAQIDQVMRAYIPLSEYETKLKKGRGGNEGGESMNPLTRPVSIMVPYSFAVRDTLLTYLDETFLVDRPLQYDGQGPEDIIGAKLLELVVDQQVRRQKAALIMRTAFSDGLTYGLGPSTFDWVTKWGRKATTVQRPVFGLSGEILGYQPTRQNVDALLYEGNRIFSVDPYRYLPDPNVSSDRLQDGEFVGWTLPVTIYHLQAQEKADPSVFNVRYLQDSPARAAYTGQASSKLVPSQVSRVRDAGEGMVAGTKTLSTRYVQLLKIFITLIPKEWGLNELEEPEIWYFQVADDNYILSAQPIDMNHRSYPVAVASPDYDGYSITPVSRMETVQGLQTTLNWMFNSHVANVRKSINDMLIVDPSLVTMADLENPDPGKLVRLRRSAWGRGVENAVKQLTVQDVTRGNMADAAQLMDMINRSTGAVDALQGIMRSGGERRSAFEAKSTTGSALSRLQSLARVMGIQYMQDLAYFYASHTQQYMSEATALKATGTWPEELAREYGQAGQVVVSPFDLLVDFDVVYRDGSTPTSGAENAEVWGQLMQQLLASEWANQVFDVPRIFIHVARLLGAKDVWSFVRNGGRVAPQIVPNEQILAQAQAGNVVPLDQMAQAA